jgi:zona occludens toxin
MEFLVTGQPGNGKTIYTLNYVEKLRQDTGRAVYQDGVGGLTLPWLQLPLIKGPFDAKALAKGFPAMVPDWASVPDGAIVVVDEAWRYFPPRGTGIAPPYIQFLAEHRHRGMDIFLVTQGPNQIDSFVKTLVGKHFHCDRRFGVDATRLWQWERCANPKSDKDKKEGQSSRWVFPKESYSWYTSAVEHTHKKDLPWKKIGVAVAASVVIVFGLVFVVHNFRANAHRLDRPSAGGEGTVARVSEAGKNLLDAGSSYWSKGRIERVSGLPQSAPIYDGLQKPQTQPRIEGCMSIVRKGIVRCSCSGPNSAELDIPTMQCVQYVRRGWFDETKRYDDVKQRNIDYLNSLERVASSGDGSQTAQQPAKP